MSGNPTAIAVAQPSSTIAIDDARLLSGTSRAAVPAASGVNAPAMVSIASRVTRRLEKFGANADAMCPNDSHNKIALNSERRSMRLETQTTPAPKLTSNPTVPMLAPRPTDSSVNIPIGRRMLRTDDKVARRQGDNG